MKTATQENLKDSFNFFNYPPPTKLKAVYHLKNKNKNKTLKHRLI